jgi:hypothetical protein
MIATVTGLYDTYSEAEMTVHDLKEVDIPDADIALLSNNVSESMETSDGAATGAGAGAAAGGVAGAGVGVLAGLGLLAIPGVGPVVAAGWLAAAAVGAAAGVGAGAMAGGLIGALTDSGVSNDEAHVYAEGVRRGGTLVTVRVDDSRIGAIGAIVARHGRVDHVVRERTFRDGGWTSFDRYGAPYTAAEIARDRAARAARRAI